jgi:hypothetical protein
MSRGNGVQAFLDALVAQARQTSGHSSPSEQQSHDDDEDDYGDMYE